MPMFVNYSAISLSLLTERIVTSFVQQIKRMAAPERLPQKSRQHKQITIEFQITAIRCKHRLQMK